MMEALESLVVDHAADAQFRKPDIGDEIGAGWLIAVARWFQRARAGRAARSVSSPSALPMARRRSRSEDLVHMD